jgi:hypothetical protein
LQIVKSRALAVERISADTGLVGQIFSGKLALAPEVAQAFG